MCGDKLMQRIRNKHFELPLNQEAKLIVDFSKHYDDVYFDSTLYFDNGIQKYKLINDSFAFTIGMGLFKRSYCLNDYQGDNFIKEFTENDSVTVSFLHDMINRFELCECENYAMYLFREKGQIRFLLFKLHIKSNEHSVFVHHDLFFETILAEGTLKLWREILEKEFIPRYVAEIKRGDQEPTELQIASAIHSLKESR